MNKTEAGQAIKIAEKLLDELETFTSDLEDAIENGNEIIEPSFTADYLVDSLLNTHRILYAEGVEEGHFYRECILKANFPIQLFQTIEVRKGFTEEKETLQVMSIINIKPKEDGSYLINFLGKTIE